ncbi:hypothetical protein WMF28_10090 [Sorangium sp. So ce590]|uniref:hypothetical protein n=1 Tax=Sorangium sp. So ce590 TaxID=3133317 RepID=UPI003F5F77AD
MIEETDPLLASLSPRAKEALQRAGARIDETARGTREALDAALRERGLPPLAGVLDAEAHFGGLTWAAVVVHPMRFARAVPSGRTEDNAVALAVGLLSGKELFVDERGRVHGRSAHGDPLIRLADSLFVLIEKVTLFDSVEPLRPRVMRVSFTPCIGASLAAAVGAQRVPEASDGVHTFWELPGILIGDGGALIGARDATRVWTSSVRDAARVIRAMNSERVTLDLARGDAPCTVDAHPSSATPEAPVPSGVRFASADGWVSVEEESSLAQVRARAGRIERWTTFDEGGTFIRSYAPDFDALIPRLSAAALESLIRADASRDPALTCSRAELSALLERHGLPAQEALFEMEEAAGGLRVIGTRPFGPYATLRAMRGRPTRVYVESGYVMDEHGRILFEDPDADVSAAVADSWRVFLERWARSVDPRRKSRFALRIDRVVGAEVARELGAEPAPSASDSVCSVWESPYSVVLERRVPIPFYSPPFTEATSDDGDAVVAAIQRIHARDPEARMWATLGPTAADAPLVVDVPRWDPPDQTSPGRLRIRGVPGAYFVERS